MAYKKVFLLIFLSSFLIMISALTISETLEKEKIIISEFFFNDSYFVNMSYSNNSVSELSFINILIIKLKDIQQFLLILELIVQ